MCSAWPQQLEQQWNRIARCALAAAVPSSEDVPRAAARLHAQGAAHTPQSPGVRPAGPAAAQAPQLQQYRVRLTARHGLQKLGAVLPHRHVPRTWPPPQVGTCSMAAQRLGSRTLAPYGHMSSCLSVLEKNSCRRDTSFSLPASCASTSSSRALNRKSLARSHCATCSRTEPVSVCRICTAICSRSSRAESCCFCTGDSFVLHDVPGSLSQASSRDAPCLFVLATDLADQLLQVSAAPSALPLARASHCDKRRCCRQRTLTPS